MTDDNKILFICMTYGQIINTIQIVNTIVQSEMRCDLIITDYCKNAENISSRIKALGTFENVFLLRIKNEYYRGNAIKKIKKGVKLFESSKSASRKFGIKRWDYSELYFTDFSLLANQVFFYIKAENPKCKIYRIEEGYSTYTVFNANFPMERVAKLYGRIARKSTIYESLDGLFLYDVDMLQYDTYCKTMQIPLICKYDTELIEKLDYIFDVNIPVEITKRKFIFFEESFSVDNAEEEGFDDMKLIEQVIGIVGEENICIKTHPRTLSIERYKRFGKIEIMNSSVPWELMYLNSDLKDKTLLTISSGSVINALPWTRQPAKVAILYKCIKPRPRLCTGSYEKYLRKMTEKYGDNNFLIPDSLSDFADSMEVTN